jgi:glutaredoxin
VRYFEVYAWTECPFCVHAKELLIEKGEQFMFCCLDQSDVLLTFLKKKYDWETVPMIIEKYTDSNEERFIGGFTDLVKYLGEKSDGKS